MQRGRIEFAALLGIGAAAAAVSLGAAGAQAPASRSGSDDGGGRQLIAQYCAGCHNDRAKIGGVSFDHADFASVASEADLWERAIRKLRSGQMPPAGRARLDATAVEHFVSTLESALDRAAAVAPNPGRPVTHR